MNKKNIIALTGCAILIVVIFFGFISNYFNTKKTISILQGKGSITKAIMNIETSSNLMKITITDADTLNYINDALKNAQLIDVPRGGAFDISVRVYIEKNGKNANFEILKSQYYGWRLEIGDKYFRSDDLFKLIQGLIKN